MTRCARSVGAALCAALLVPLALGLAPGCVCGSTDPQPEPQAPSARRLTPFRAPSARTVELPAGWRPPKLDRDAVADP